MGGCHQRRDERGGLSERRGGRDDWTAGERERPQAAEGVGTGAWGVSGRG